MSCQHDICEVTAAVVLLYTITTLYYFQEHARVITTTFMLCLSMSVTLVISCLYWNWMVWCVCSSTCIIGTWMMIIHSRSEQSQNSVLSMVACTHSLCFPVISHLTFLNTKLCIWILCIWSHVNCDCWSSCMKPTSVKIQSECVIFKAQVELGGLTCKLRLHSGLCHTGIWRVVTRLCSNLSYYCLICCDLGSVRTSRGFCL